MKENEHYYFRIAIDESEGEPEPVRLSDLSFGETINALDLDPVMADMIFGKPVMDELRAAADNPQPNHTYRVSKIESGSVTFDLIDD